MHKYLDTLDAMVENTRRAVRYQQAGQPDGVAACLALDAAWFTMLAQQRAAFWQSLGIEPDEVTPRGGRRR